MQLKELTILICFIFNESILVSLWTFLLTFVFDGIQYFVFTFFIGCIKNDFVSTDYSLLTLPNFFSAGSVWLKINL